MDLSTIHPGLREAVVAALEEINGAPNEEAAGIPTDLEALRALIRRMLGQQPMPPAGWSMSNNRLATRVALLEALFPLKGDTGERGFTGDTGAQGPKGDTGSQGSKGDKGDIGPKGDTGQQGLKGDTGLQGIKGDTGLTGAKGDTGTQGIKGDTGAQGVKGDTGLQGSAGIDITNTKIRSKRVATPQMLITANPVVSVTWDTPFADSNYTLQATLQSTNTGLLGLVPTIITLTPTGASVKLNILLALAAGVGTVHFFAFHD